MEVCESHRKERRSKLGSEISQRLRFITFQQRFRLNKARYHLFKSQTSFDKLLKFVSKNKNKQYSSQSLPVTRSSLLASSPRQKGWSFFAIHWKSCAPRLLSSPERLPVDYISHSKLRHNSKDRHNQWNCNDHC
jgi:hypothetical protein